MLPKNKLFILAGIFLAGLLVHSIYRDLQLRKLFPSDLRNRIVGARLQKDGILPYFYYWQPGDGPRHWDPSNCNQRKGYASKITASPFFHELLFPICDYPMLTISWIWLCFQYLMLGGMIWMFCSLTKNRTTKMLLIAAGVLFTATEAWKSEIMEGQLYFFVAFLIGCIIVALVRNKRPGILFAGICAAIFVLTRPIALVIFTPFLFRYKEYALFLSTAFISLTLYGLMVLLIPFETALWKDYAHALKEHAAYHQNGGLITESGNSAIEIKDCPPANALEGFTRADIEKALAEHHIEIFSECGNVFVIYEEMFHKKMPLYVLNGLSALTLILLSGSFFYCFKEPPAPAWQIAIFASTLYMIVELFNPIHRNQYNTVQWFPIVLAGLSCTAGWKKPAFLLLTLGLILNISNAPWILMRHTLGEICWLAASLLIVFYTRKQQAS